MLFDASNLGPDNAEMTTTKTSSFYGHCLRSSKSDGTKVIETTISHWHRRHVNFY